MGKAAFPEASKFVSLGDVMLPEGVVYLPSHLAANAQASLYAEIERVVESAPFYVPRMAGTGRPFSVEMTNCGVLGWVSDKNGGYRYQELHPLTGRAWPKMPAALMQLWREVSGCEGDAEACLINLYRGKARLGSHVDRDEEAASAPVVSVSLGDSGVFHIGGRRRSDPKSRLVLRSGDVILLGGPARFAYHGIDRILPGTSDLVAGGGRINLTLRRVRALA